MYIKSLQLKLNDALNAVLPIIGIVLLLSLTIAPLPSEVLLVFLLGGLMLIIGMMFFSLGAELSMEMMGASVGTNLTKTKKIGLILVLSAFLGLMITISEPDLQVLAKQVTSIPDNVLIYSVAAGVGIFLALAVMRMFYSISFRILLFIFYSITFILAAFAPKEFLSVAFDSGGVTTGPMTVPFIMAFGVGLSSVRSDKNASGDSFGLIALCSVGPIIAVLILSIVYNAGSSKYIAASLPEISHSVDLGKLFAIGLPQYMKEIAFALLPIMLFFFVFQLVSLHLNRNTIISVVTGLVYTYLGLVIFLTGVNIGFMPAGSYLGSSLAALSYKWVIVPIGMIIGYFIVKAEPAVYVLMKQVEDITSGAIKGKTLQISLSVGVSVSVGFAMLRVLTGISIMWIIGPGYFLSFLMTFFVPDIFTTIAFDSGGVASGPMTATFLLPLAEGACIALGGNVVTDAFGVVALVAMTPLITIQILGLVYAGKQKHISGNISEDSLTADDYAIIDL